MVGREAENGFSKHTPSLAFTRSHFEQIFIAVSGVPLAFLEVELGAGERDRGRRAHLQCSPAGRKKGVSYLGGLSPACNPPY